MTIGLLVLVILINGLILFVLWKRKPNNAAELAINAALDKNVERIDKTIKNEFLNNRTELTTNSKSTREELTGSIKSLSDSIDKRNFESAQAQNKSLESLSSKIAELTEKNEKRLEQVKEAVEKKLEGIQKSNEDKLEKMRATVDEKLHATLERRLGESFKLVSDRLEQVHKGLGEMQNLASGVGDLKKVLTNVKTRGVWGEVQLGSLLEQILNPDQYETNVATKPRSNERVEYAIKLPGPEDSKKPVWLPIDAKFPQEDYQKLVEAYEKADLALVDEASKQLEARIKSEAKSIRDKYINPPNTTDFGILFLPYESLYAEVARRPGLCEMLQRQFRVIVTSPLTLGALLNSLQMGFRTLAIQKRSGEVWAILGAVKTEFGRFGDILEKTQKKLTEASNTIEDAAKKSRTIERKLKNVQELPVPETTLLLENLESEETALANEQKNEAELQPEDIPF